MGKKCTNTTETIEFNGQTGEVNKHITSKTYAVSAEPDYVKLYFKHMLYLKDLPKGLNSILMELLKYMTYAEDGNMLYLNSEMKKRIAKDLNTSVGYIDKAITQFVKGDLLFRRGLGTYEVNSHLFGKGKWEHIQQIQMTVTFDSNGKTIMSEIKKKDSKQRELENQMSLAIAQ